jgi:polyhydroxybutyrate depolymerase
MLKTLVIAATLITMGFYLVIASKKGVDETFWLNHDGIDRKTIVHLPPKVEDDSKLPLVFVFHGLLGNANYTKNTYGITEISDREGFIAAYPVGTGPLKSVFLSWNGDFCCSYAKENEIDDARYIVELLKELKRNYPVDENRVYLVGLSNGGMLTYKLVSEYPELFAAAAIVSSSPAGGASEDEVCRIEPPPKPVPMIIFHGMLDPIIPYHGGYSSASEESICFPSIPEAIDLWIAGMNAVELEETSLEGGKVLLKKYGRPGEDFEIHFYTIVDGDHTWPGREKGLDALQSSSKSCVNASELIWDFFRDRRLE